MMHQKISHLLRVVVFVLTITLTFNTTSSFAVPAKLGLKAIKQPDGSIINIEIQGDEHFHWRSTEAGDAVVRGEDGYYYYALYSSVGVASATNHRALINGALVTPPADVATQNMREIAAFAGGMQRAASRAEASSATTRSGVFPSVGTIKSVIILVEYSDVKFTVDDPNRAFYNQLNEEGYSVEGATGSARDYYTANSQGAFDGQFDVYGPYTLDNKQSYYGANDRSGNDYRPAQMVWDAVELADQDGVDFSQYDYDDDGYIDNVFVYYAGYNEAEGGDEDTVWPHKWVVSSAPYYDGKRLYTYACTSELRGYSGEKIAGIGTFCHEFGHVFGLYDHYDTNYDTNGYSYGLGDYDIMTSGSYNNDGNTPPLFNALEMNTIGWCESEVLSSAQSIIIKPIQYHQTYKVLTEQEGEYFLIENRSKESSVWDSYIPASGLLIYHVDESSDVAYLWAQNGPNSNTAHECFKFVVAGNVSMNGYNWNRVPYPYAANTEWSFTSSPAALSWDGVEVGINIVDIARSGVEDITFKSILAGEGSVNIIVNREDGLNDSYVGDIIPLSAILYPEVEDGSVGWSSSDEEIATVSEDGVVTLLSSGMVTISATYLAQPVYVGSITLSVSDLQGARGTILSNDGEPLSGATLDFYPTTRSYDGQQSLFTRSSSEAQSVVSNSSGIYRASLAAGYYEVEVGASLYVDIIEVVEVGDGVTMLDFSLTGYSDRVDTITVEPYQIDASVEWNPQNYKYFSLSLSGPSEYSGAILTTDCTYELTDLTADSDYTLTVSASQDGQSYEQIYEVEFSTLAKLTSMPMIRLSAYDYAVDEVIELRTVNTTSTDTTVWYIDSVEQSRTKVVLDAGEHMIQAVVTRGSTVYRVTKFINVK